MDGKAETLAGVLLGVAIVALVDMGKSDDQVMAAVKELLLQVRASST